MFTGMIAAPQPEAAEVGQEVLLGGGNAFDAAVAVALVQCVVDPTNTSLGGSGCAVFYDANAHEYGCLSFMSRAGSKVWPAMWQGRDEPVDVGYASACVPGNIRGFARLLCERGSMPWADILWGALQASKKGIVARGPLAAGRSVSEGNPDPFHRISSSAARKVFLKSNNSPHGYGEIIAVDDLTRTLEALQSHGPDWFYVGDFARIAVRDNEQNGGWLTYQDFKDYTPRNRCPVVGTYRGLQYYGAPPPASGSSVIHILRLLSSDNLGELGHNSVDFLHLLTEAMKVEFQDRRTYLGDDAPYEEAVSLERSLAQRKLIRRDRARGRVESPSEPGTTHLSVMDRNGSAVALTHSIGNAFGSGVMPPGTGVLLNGHMDSFSTMPGVPNEIAPGKARRTAISSSILAREDGPVIAVGASGSARIITSVVQTIVNIVDFGLSPSEALLAPRMRYVGGTLGLERRIPASVATELSSRGHDVEHSLHGLDHRYGLCHVVTRSDKGVLGAADPRSDGMALGTR